LPVLLPLAAQGLVACKLGTTTASVASHIEVWAPLGISAMVMLGITYLAHRYRVRSKAHSADNIDGVQRLDPILVAKWAPAIIEAP
jgi:hypothetical protein